MDTVKDEQNKKALEAKDDLAKRNEFLSSESKHILNLTGVILKRRITDSDDEWSIALSAVSEAIDGYKLEKGDFWSYASIVIKSRLLDMYRREKRSGEILVSPESFSGETDEERGDLAMGIEIREKLASASPSENNLKDEIAALSTELSEYKISFFDLAECSPKSEKTKFSCSMLIRSLFTPPPPLTKDLKNTKTLPIKAMLSRFKVSRKLIDRHRKYLIASALILDGDYPALADYLGNIKLEIQKAEKSLSEKRES